MPRTRDTAISLLLIATAVLLVFGRSIGYELLNWDDHMNISLNPMLNPPSWEGLTVFWKQPYLKLYAPMAYTAFAFEAWLSGLNIPPGQDFVPDPRVFRAANVLLHLVNSLLVFGILRTLIRSSWPACLGALLFALHPLQVESVGWVTEQRGLLSHAFGLGAALLVLTREQEKRTRANGSVIAAAIRYTVATLLLVLSLLSKPSAAVVPLMTFVLLVAAGTDWKRATALMLPWLVLAFVCIAMAKRIQPDTLNLYLPPLWQRPFIAGDALAFYMFKGLWPAGLCADYGRTPKIVMQHGSAYANWLLPGVLLLGAWFAGRKMSGPAKLLLPATILSIAAVSPLLGLVPFGFQNWSTVADRYVYLAMLGPALVLTGVSATFVSRRAISVPVVILLAGLGVLSFRQVGFWRNDETLFIRALTINPDSGLGHNHMGTLATRNRDFVGAMYHLKKAIAANPAAGQPWNNLGMVLANEERYAEARDHFVKSVSLDPLLPSVYNNLGAISQKLGDFESAVTAYRRALRFNPRLTQTWVNLGLALVHTGRHADSIPCFERAIEIQPDMFMPHRELGVLLDRMGHTNEAIAVYLRAVELAPAPDLHRRMANLYIGQNNPQRAAHQFRETLRLIPGDPEAGKGLARLEKMLADDVSETP
jgi:Flp pilus assembly protein TadD